jgi:nucleotide-binding universal stress UspA family protein
MSRKLFQKILVPLDGSEHSLKALDVAIEMAKKFGGKITLVHVYSMAGVPGVMPEPSMATAGVPVMTAPDVSRLVEAARKAGSRILEDGEQRVKAEKVEVNKLLEEGHTVQEIIRVAKEGNFELIVMGARGISHIREMLLGSVSDGVMHHVACPVLVVK